MSPWTEEDLFCAALVVLAIAAYVIAATTNNAI